MKILRSCCFPKVLTLLVWLTSMGLALDLGAYESIANKQNDVRVEVRPVQLIPDQPVMFEVRMNTHSVALNQDMVFVSTLKDSHGNTFQPVKWEGSPPGGHHRKGVLEFPALQGNPGSVTLVIKDVANVPTRVFEWRVAQ